jgi:hypothetical protein
MRVDNCEPQIQLAAGRADLIGLFGELSFANQEVQMVAAAAEGDALMVRFGNSSGPVGGLYVDICDSGDPDDASLTVGLRGSLLDGDIASV